MLVAPFEIERQRLVRHPSPVRGRAPQPAADDLAGADRGLALYAQHVDPLEEADEDAADTVEALVLSGLDLAHYGTQADADTIRDDEGLVTLMTMHNAKGLEYPIVFMIGMEDGVFPHARSLDDENRIEEERRLAYVGITRARQKLVLSYAESRRIHGSDTAIRASDTTSSCGMPNLWPRPPVRV